MLELNATCHPTPCALSRLYIRNYGPIHELDASDLKRFNLISGPEQCGKSYVQTILYSMASMLPDPYHVQHDLKHQWVSFLKNNAPLGAATTGTSATSIGTLSGAGLTLSRYGLETSGRPAGTEFDQWQLTDEGDIDREKGFEAIMCSASYPGSTLWEDVKRTAEYIHKWAGSCRMGDAGNFCTREFDAIAHPRLTHYVDSLLEGIGTPEYLDSLVRVEKVDTGRFQCAEQYWMDQPRGSTSQEERMQWVRRLLHINSRKRPPVFIVDSSVMPTREQALRDVLFVLLRASQLGYMQVFLESGNNALTGMVSSLASELGITVAHMHPAGKEGQWICEDMG